MTAASDDIAAELRQLVGLAEGAEATPEQATRIRKLGRLSTDLVEIACDRAKADGLSHEEVIASVGFAIRALEHALRIISAAAALRELCGEDATE